MDIIYPPSNHNELESLIERIHPPGICVDNDTCEDCTLIKVDSANKHGILLEMVQVLTDLDLIISKSYISSDGGWFMDVFHVTDQLGNKLTDETLILYIKQVLCVSRRDVNMGASEKINMYLGREVRPGQKDTAVEMTGIDSPGLVSEISAVLVGLGCNITAASAWTHNSRAACIVYIENGPRGGPITDPIRLAHIQEQLQNVVEAHHSDGEKRGVSLTDPGPARAHTERRLHQLMHADGDYERCRGCNGDGAAHKRGCDRTHVTIDSCEEKEYWIVNVQSRDRPKLLFDTVCALTDLGYVVFHASVSSNKSTKADQEYFIRHKYGYHLDREREQHKLKLCLVAAIERRISQGLRLELSSGNQMGLLSDITRVFREYGLSMSRIELVTRDDRAFGSIFVTDTSGHGVNQDMVELAIKEIGGSIIAFHKTPDWASRGSSPSTSPTTPNIMVEHRPRSSLGSLLWSQFERLSSSFNPIRS